jgi:hypothetical protein
MVPMVLETSLSVILACIPVLRPLFRSAISTLQTKSALGNYGTTTNQKAQKLKTGGFSVIEEQPSSPAPSGPMPKRPEIAYFSAEAARASRSEHNLKGREDFEMGGITVTTEFVARYSHINA